MINGPIGVALLHGALSGGVPNIKGSPQKKNRYWLFMAIMAIKKKEKCVSKLWKKGCDPPPLLEAKASLWFTPVCSLVSQLVSQTFRCSDVQMFRRNWLAKYELAHHRADFQACF